jgi:ABC-type nitrate/sulfonate/bicarbonate transport system substrate-binding protein
MLPACAPAPTPTKPAAPAATAAPATRASRTFKSAYLTLGWAGIEAIDALGLLKERGWNVEWQRVGPISGLVNAFSSGQADIIDMSAVIVGQMYEQGVKMNVFGAGVGTLGAVVAGKNSDIRSIAELKGKKVGGVPGGTTTQDINASIRKAYGFDVFKETQFVQGTAPPDVANLLTKGDVEAVLIWEPTTTQLTQAGTGTILATQQQLWEQASGSRSTQVHVVYLASPQITRDHPDLLADINAAQRQVADLWTNKDPKLIKAFTEVTQLPESVVQEALGRTTPLFGLRDDTINTILQQLQFNRQYGTILESDVWSGDTAKIRNELFVRVGEA